MNAFKTAFIICFIIITILSVMTNSVLHKSFMVENTEYKINNTKNPAVSANIQSRKQEIQTRKIQNTNEEPQKIIVQVIEEHVKTLSRQVETSAPNSTVNTQIAQPNNSELLERVVKNAQTPTAIKQETIKNTTAETSETKTINIENKPLTEEEEIIAWNKWRSDLQNQIMEDSRIAAPMGTKFNFSFTVDKNGNVSNINTWSDNNYYTPMAKRVIKPILTSYQHTSVLNFPPRTKRTIVNVQGGFVMAPISRYSSPSDYSDYERIRR